MGYELADFIVVKTVTPLHPGIGRSGEVVELPVQRDELGFPAVYSSSIKGALKSAIGGELSKFLFGPEVEDSEKFSGPMAVLDAYLLATPVRSLAGVYGYATCPVLLKRCKSYIDLVSSLGKASNGEFQKLREAVEELLKVSVEGGEVYVARDDLSLVPQLNKVIVNEELRLEQRFDKSIASSLAKLGEVIGLEKDRMMLLSDGDGARAVEKSLMRVTRVRLERETKTVKEGGLWDEEYIPRETVLYTALLYSKPRVPDDVKKRLGEVFGASEPGAEDVKRKLAEELGKRGNYLVIGGHETIGRGIVKLEFL